MILTDAIAIARVVGGTPVHIGQERFVVHFRRCDGQIVAITEREFLVYPTASELTTDRPAARATHPACK